MFIKQCSGDLALFEHDIHCTCIHVVINIQHEKSVGLSSTTNPKPKGQPSISLPAQANLTQQKAEPLRCLALRTRSGRL